MFKKIIFFITVLCFLIPLKSAQAGTAVNRIVAHVNGEAITLFDLQKRVEMFLGLFEDIELADLPPDQQKETKRHVLDQMINDILMRQEAERYQIQVSDRDIQEHIQRVQQDNNMDQEEFEKHLRMQGLTQDDYKRQIRDSMITQRVLGIMVRRKTVVTQDEIKEYFKANQENFQEEKKIHLQVIAVPDYDEAVRLLDRIQNGEYDFDSAAQKYSQGPAARDGGDLGLVRWDRLAPEWKEALKNLKPGEISEPFSVSGGGVLLMARDIQSERQIPLEEVKDDIRNKLFDDKLDQRFEEYIQGLRDRAVIEVRY